MLQELKINEELCVGCMLCANNCPSKVILNKGKAFIKTATTCLDCDQCYALCPTGAITRAHQPHLPNLPNVNENVSPELLLSLIQSKRSVRQYTQQAVEPFKLEKILEVGRISPTASNIQGTSFVVINDPEKLETLKLILLETAKQMSLNMKGRYKVIFETMLDNYKTTGFDRLFHNATSIIIFKGKPSLSPSLTLDAGIAAGQMSLMGEALGLSSCFIGFLPMILQHSHQGREWIGLESDETVTTSLVLG